MTRKSMGRKDRDARKWPKQKDIASIKVDEQQKCIEFYTKDILLNQLKREGPKISRSFDQLLKKELVTCSALYAEALVLLLEHLPMVNDNSYKPTVSRLLFNASNSIAASIEVARHGYPLQYGAVARMLVETLATVLVIATDETRLVEFHAGKLKSSKCVGWSKRALPIIAPLWGMLSDDFVHISQRHSEFSGPKKYNKDDEVLKFFSSSMTSNVWLFYVVCELVFFEETTQPKFWKEKGGGYVFEPSKSGSEWMDQYLSVGAD